MQVWNDSAEWLLVRAGLAEPGRRRWHMAMTDARALERLPTPGRFPYTAIDRRADYCWPNRARPAVYIGFNIEHFAFAEGQGACIGPPSPQPDVLNYSWREYGNRVGATVWRCSTSSDCRPEP